ncbi:MAG: phosphoenolpyruvate synthase [Caldilinea sp. CFX5]|nr:phosphoenolpyruvate synthase [Caldilinea sp. CFX5]
MSHESPLPLVLALDDAAATLERVGGKGASLARLVRAGLPVPPGFHITTAAYRRFVQENGFADAILTAAAQAQTADPASLERAAAAIQSLIGQGTIPDDIAALIRQWYGNLGDDNPAVAVRSSATAEDLPELSFAGQQETYLNVRGGENVLAAVKRCWASLWTARVLGYRARQGIHSAEVSLAVVVQQLVPAEAAGILFTANPLTGSHDEMMINAAWGLGEAIVGGQVTPDTLVVNKQTGALIFQEITDKAVTTVRVPSGTREEATPAAQRTQAALQPAQATKLAQLGGQIERLYGQPMDIEWARHEGRFFILQARPITALSAAPATLTWPLPRTGGQYARSSVIELLPDPLSPLFATLALPLWDAAMRQLFQTIGFVGLLPDQMLVTINQYAYYDFGMSAGQSLRMVGRILGGVPKLARLLGSAYTRWADVAHPRYKAVVDSWATRDLRATPAAQLLDGVYAIVSAAAAHYLAVQSGILPVAYASEALFTLAYNRLARGEGDPPALTFMLGFDSEPIRAEKSLYDLAGWAQAQPTLAAYLANRPSAEIAAAYQADSTPSADVATWQEFKRRFGAHLARFGYAVYDLDFAKPLPADDPAPLLETLKHFLAGQGRSPYARQAAAAAAREQATQSLPARLRGARLRLFRWLLPIAQRYAPLREDALAEVGLGWPLVRRMLHEVGERLVAAGALAARDDLFWLKWKELISAVLTLDAHQALSDFRPLVAERRAAWARAHAVTPPVTLPVKGGARLWGIDFSRLMPAHTDQAAGGAIKGIGASPGRVTGVARVIHGPGEFDQMQQGDILVAKITTPAWTPLFALAAGVVTDVGGPLSHSSIVAREYHIPAVLGTGVATARLYSGQRITVDGDNGMVMPRT